MNKNLAEIGISPAPHCHERSVSASSQGPMEKLGIPETQSELLHVFHADKARLISIVFDLFGGL